MSKSLTSTATKDRSKTGSKDTGEAVRGKASACVATGKKSSATIAYKSTDSKNGRGVSKNVQQGNKYMEEAWALISQRSSAKDKRR